jgi:hypothetical protein
VSTLLLAAVGGSRWQPGVALSADHLLAVVLGGKGLEGGFDDTATETEDEMKSRFLLDVVVAQRPAIFELLSGEDQSLLVRWDAFLVLDLGLDVVDGVGRLHLEGDSLAREGLDEAIISIPVSILFPSCFSSVVTVALR